MAKDWERKLKRELQNEGLKEFENWTSAEFATYIVELRKEIETLKSLTSLHPNERAEKAKKQPLNESLFKQTWSYPTKIHFLLELHQRPLTSEELSKHLLRLDSHFKDYNSPQKNLSVHLNRAIKSGRIKRIKLPGIRALYFALPEWMNVGGELSDAFSNLNPFN